MAALTAVSITTSGVAPTMVPADALGDSVSNTGNEVVEITAGATGATVTFVAQGRCNHGVLHDLPVVVPANQTRDIGPFRDLLRWNDVNGKLQWTYDQVVTVTVGVTAR